MYEMPFDNLEALQSCIDTVIKDTISNESYIWLQERVVGITSKNDPLQLQVSFAAISRKIERKTVWITPAQEEMISNFFPGLHIQGWTITRLCRVYILMTLNAVEKVQYLTAIESLFINAEMNERADLYAALPILAYPLHWVKFCIEGIRSNIGVVQEAIMYYNPFPAKYLEEAPWNQLVLKAFFTEKNINLINGIDDRANAPLASTLIDYAMERWAAKRAVNGQLWRLVTKFIDDKNMDIIARLFISDDENTRLAAALACSGSSYLPAKALLDLHPAIKNNIRINKLSWSNISM